MILLSVITSQVSCRQNTFNHTVMKQLRFNMVMNRLKITAKLFLRRQITLIS